MNEVQVAEQLRGSFIESVLLTLYEHGGAMSHSEVDAFTGDHLTTHEALADLYERELVRQPDSEGAELSAFGTRVAKLVKASLLGGQRRADIVQRKLLQWLTHAEPTSIQDFNGLPEASDAGVAFTPEEIENAAELLSERGFMRAFNTLAGSWLRPEITADGRAALMSNVLIADYGRPNPSPITYDYSSRVSFGDHATTGGVISGGQGNTQHITQTITGQQAKEVSDKASELLEIVDLLPADVETEPLRESLEQLKAAATEAKPISTLNGLTQKALAAAASAAGTDLGHRILAGIAHIAQVLS